MSVYIPGHEPQNSLTGCNPAWAFEPLSSAGTGWMTHSYTVMHIYGSAFRVSIMDTGSECWPLPRVQWFSATVLEPGIQCSATGDTRRAALDELRRRLIELAVGKLRREALE